MNTLKKLQVQLFRVFFPKPIKEMTYIPLTPETAEEIKKQLPVQTEVKPDYLTLLFNAMKDFEGGPNDLNHKNNNPLNCRCSSVGYLPKYGNVKCVNRFAVFPTWEIGCEYGRNLILHKARKHPEWNLINFIGHPTEGWAPASDNNPVTAYANYIGKRMGVNPFVFQLKELL